ncbi:BQ2448_57 [Microbotryum intermedium]|uniref:BQ2448_57 protein n=1 Tax=Microbotryum intermedium TaxID=269621 RepID=A0A238FA16_9BASI|nr:BQ2448_57 [Microbotryum intermedium]
MRVFTWLPTFAVASLAFTLASAAVLPAGNGGSNDITLQKRTPPSCLPFNCPQIPHATSTCTGPGGGSCDFTCDKGYKKSGDKCVATSPTCVESQCPCPSHGAATCTAWGCDITCNTGYKKKHGRCVKDCDKSKCPWIANSVSWCTTSGDCNYTCNSSYKKKGGKCCQE